MVKYKHKKTIYLHKNYTQNQSGYQLNFHLILNVWSQKMIRFVCQFVEGMDLTDLYYTYDQIRENSVSPRTLQKSYFTRTCIRNLKRDT